jgi:hypothetical protein
MRTQHSHELAASRVADAREAELVPEELDHKLREAHALAALQRRNGAVKGRLVDEQLEDEAPALPERERPRRSLPASAKRKDAHQCSHLERHVSVARRSSGRKRQRSAVRR